MDNRLSNKVIKVIVLDVFAIWEDIGFVIRFAKLIGASICWMKNLAVSVNILKDNTEATCESRESVETTR